MVGRTVSHYQVLEKLGAGGMGEIYKALDPRLNRFVAIKVLPAGMSADPERRRRFIQEAQAASGLNHPNIITFYGTCQTPSGLHFYVVTEFIKDEPNNLGTLLSERSLSVHDKVCFHSFLKSLSLQFTEVESPD